MQTRRLIAGCAVVVLAAAGVVIWRVADGSAPRAAAAPVVAPAISKSAAPSSSARPTPKPKPKPVVPHQAVAPAAPSSFDFTNAARSIHVAASVCGMEYVRPLDPPGEQEHTVCWVQHDFGTAPGSSTTGTTYVLGHSWAQNTREVLNPVSIAVTDHIDTNKPVMEAGVPTYPTTVLDGSTLTLRTPNGTLNYHVTRAFAVAKEQAGNVPSIMNEKTPNRITLITCAVKSGHGLQDLDYNIIVDAYLYSSVASAKAA